MNALKTASGIGSGLFLKISTIFDHFCLWIEKNCNRFVVVFVWGLYYHESYSFRTDHEGVNADV